MCNIKSFGIKKMFKELPDLIRENEVTKAMNYLILALTAYKAAVEVIFDRLVAKCHNRMPNNQAFVLKNTRNSPGIIKQFSHLSEAPPIFS